MWWRSVTCWAAARPEARSRGQRGGGARNQAEGARPTRTAQGGPPRARSGGRGGGAPPRRMSPARRREARRADRQRAGRAEQGGGGGPPEAAHKPRPNSTKKPFCCSPRECADSAKCLFCCRPPGLWGPSWGGAMSKARANGQGQRAARCRLTLSPPRPVHAVVPGRSCTRLFVRFLLTDWYTCAIIALSGVRGRCSLLPPLVQSQGGQRAFMRVAGWGRLMLDFEGERYLS